jgi:prolyl-tRNA editing enzyme YbaK/EbsC (Cys-tRNA(Pro) deacylase)
MCGAELTALPEGVQKVASLLQAKEHPNPPVMLSDAARTAQQAADALFVGVGQIAKSIVFRRRSDEAAVLVVTSGDQRVDEKKLEALVCLDGKRLSRADAEFVKAKTGFSIGGVSPLAHATPVVLLIDQSLFRFDTIWAAAGHPTRAIVATKCYYFSSCSRPQHGGKSRNGISLYIGLPYERCHGPVRRLL